MHIIIRMIGIFLILGILVPSISQTKIKIYGQYIDIDRNSQGEISNVSAKINFLYLKMIDELFASNTSDSSKVRAINEALRISDKYTFEGIRETCHQSISISSNLKCLEVSINKRRMNEVFINKNKATDIALSTCMKMKTYEDEGVCLENMLSSFEFLISNNEVIKCSSEDEAILKVFCLRKLL